MLVNEDCINRIRQNIHKTPVLHGLLKQNLAFVSKAVHKEFWEHQFWEIDFHIPAANFLFISALLLRISGKNPDLPSLKTVLSIFEKYAEHYSSTMQTMPYKFLPANWGSSFVLSLYIPQIAFAYDLAQTWMDEALSKRIRANLFEPAQEHLKTCFHDCWNGHAWVDYAIATIGFLLGNKKDIVFAIDGKYGFKHHVRHEILADGRFYEDHIIYNMFFLRPLFYLAELAKLCDWPEDLYLFKGSGIAGKYQYLHEMKRNLGLSENTFHMAPPEKPLQGKRSLRLALDALLDNLLPNMAFIEDNDLLKSEVYNCHAFSLHDILLLAYNAYRSPRHGWLLQKMRKSVFAEHRSGLKYNKTNDLFFLLLHNDKIPFYPPPSMKSVWHCQARSICMRTIESKDYWRGKGIVASMCYGQNRVKSQTKRLDLDLYAYGERIFKINSLGSYSHQSGVGRDKYLANGLTVDDQPVQIPWEGKGREGQMLSWGRNGPFQIAQMRFTGAYLNVTQTRTLILHNDFLLDILEAESNIPHRWSYSLCSDGSLAVFEKQYPACWKFSEQEKTALAVKSCGWQVGRVGMSCFLSDGDWETSLFKSTINGTNKVEMPSVPGTFVRYVTLHVPHLTHTPSWCLDRAAVGKSRREPVAVMIKGKNKHYYAMAISSKSGSFAVKINDISLHLRSNQRFIFREISPF